MTRTAPLFVTAILFLIVAVPLLGTATIGLAEWEIDTPNGNRINCTDPWKENHGTSLITGGLRDGRIEKVLVSHIEWWQFHDGLVIGRAKKDQFLKVWKNTCQDIEKREEREGS